MWNLPTPPKLKIFFWCLVSGFLSLQTVLFDKKLVPNMVCTVCSDGLESFSHCFFQCIIAKGLWQLAGRDGIRGRLETLDPTDAWKSLFFSLHLSKVQIVEIVFLCWRVWKGRCWDVHGESNTFLLLYVVNSTHKWRSGGMLHKLKHNHPLPITLRLLPQG
ncbi:unnamed protein product [Linum trigynum]|uniref:Reverse transcriptase zinc-binding domain-containing protein n=1 Tax=Linum trigynum TaxID=586398 RepID=A0AAV2FZQ2_9ROSI